MIIPSILTCTGSDFNFLEPFKNEIEIGQIAHALSNLCRFTGHTNRFYSVAQHSVLVASLLPQAHALEGLLHDAAEAFIGDVSTPLKQLLPDYKAIEKRVDAAIRARFNLPSEASYEIHVADQAALQIERRELLPESQTWPIEPSRITHLLKPQPPQAAELLFLNAYRTITGK